MKEDAFNAVVARNAARAMRLSGVPAPTSSVAATTKTTPVYPTTSAAEKFTSAAVLATGSLSSWKAMATLHSLPTVFLVGTLDTVLPDEIHSRVQQYVERCSVQLAGLYGDPAYFNYPDHGMVLRASGNLAVVSAFATENTARLVASEWQHAPVAFNCVEFVEEREARAQRLFAELQNGVAHGQATAQRLRDLEGIANEEEEPFSLDALEGLVMFASAYPSMPMPELTLSGTGGIVAEWWLPTLSVTLHFTTPISVQYLVKRRNPWHREFIERSSGATTVDRVGETLKNLLPASEWPIRA